MMNHSVRVDRNAFKQGVNDVLSLTPLRDAIRTAVSFGKTHGSDFKPPKSGGEALAERCIQHAKKRSKPSE